MNLSKSTRKITSAELQNFKQMATVINPFKQFVIVATLFLNFLLLPQVHASHIVGGDISYKHLSGDDYEINLRIYRDKSSSTKFDKEVHLFVYKETTSGIEVWQNTIIVSPDQLGIDMDPLSDPCVTNPPDVEFEYKIYTTTLQLPDTSDLVSYHIASQRCCRNNALANITDPEDTGIVWYVEVPKIAIENNHTTPVFDLFPEYYICGGVDSEIDFSVTPSAPNTTIKYYPYTPFAKGDSYPDCLIKYRIDTSCIVNGDTLFFNEEMEPYYDDTNPDITVEWENADVLNQFGFNPNTSFEVDESTGIVHVNPAELGLYLVGVKAVEFLGDSIISVVRKEFEIKSVSCMKTIADFYAPITLCGDTTVSFINYSLESNSFDFYPYPGIDSTYLIQTNDVNENFVVDYPGPGVYNPVLIAYGTECNDTFSYEVVIYETDYFENLADSILQDSFLICNTDSITMNPSLFPTGYPFEENLSFLWTYNASTSNEINPTFVFSEDSEVDLVITDTLGEDCFIEKTFIINLLQTDSLINNEYVNDFYQINYLNRKG